MRGDTNFAWFVPEPSHVDNDLVDQLLKLGVVTPHFLAAVLAVDLEVPVFSARRAELLQLVPERFEFTPVPAGTDPTSLPRAADQDLLTKTVVAAIEAASPAAGSAADEFRTLLKAADAREALRQRVVAYAQRVQDRLTGDPAARQAELQRLYERLIKARRDMLEHLGVLDETAGRLLLPLPPAG